MSEETKNDSTEELESLKKQVKLLTAERDSLLSDLKDVRHEARDRRHEAKGLAEQLQALARERDDYKSKAETTTGEWQEKIDQLSDQLRSLKHEQTFAKIAQGMNVKDEAKFADLVKLAAYQPESEEPDEAKITTAFLEALKGRPWLMETATAQYAAGAATTASGGANGATTQSTGEIPGPGADRGQSLNTNSNSPPSSRPAGRL